MKYLMGTVNSVRSAGVVAAKLHIELGEQLTGDELLDYACAAVGSVGRKRKKLVGIFERAYNSIMVKQGNYID